MDLRERILASYEAVEGTREDMARRFRVSLGMVKSLLRSAEARTPEELIAEIGRALAQVTAKDAPGWFASCGYGLC